jgi:hypothetical protein
VLSIKEARNGVAGGCVQQAYAHTFSMVANRRIAEPILPELPTISPRTSPMTMKEKNSIRFVFFP